VLNLLVNARDAIGENGQLLLRSRPAPPPAATPPRRASTPPPSEGLLISVTDNGPGIDANTMQRIFEPFFTTKSQGSGLGLATAYGLVRASDGEMFVDSTLGVGTEFSVWIPSSTQSLRPSGIVVSEPPEHGSSAAPSGEQLSVLLCDDDGMILQALSRMLRDLGHDVTMARNLSDAWSCWQRSPDVFSVLITDVRLGTDRGTELARRVLADRPDTLVILMSGDFQSIDVLNPVWARAAHLQKPFDRSALCAALSSKRRRAPRS
jgi:CheY-like chemotaxis protein